MAATTPQNVLDHLKSTNGRVITCKAAVAWEAKKPLDITDIQVSFLHVVKQQLYWLVLVGLRVYNIHI